MLCEDYSANCVISEVEVLILVLMEDALRNYSQPCVVSEVKES